MKLIKLIIIFSILITQNISAFADSSVAFKYNGEQQVYQMINKDIFRTYYEERIINTTCWNGPHPYPCQRIIRVPINVFDHHIDSYITMYFDESSELVSGDFFRLFYNHEFREQLILIENDTNSNILALGKVINYSSDPMGPRLINHNIGVSLKFKEDIGKIISPILSPLKNTLVEDRILSFDSSKIFTLNNFFVHLKITKKTFFTSKVIYNDIVPNNYLELSPFGADRTMVGIDLESLCDNLEADTKYTFNITQGLDFNGYMILNERYTGINLTRTKKIKASL